MYSCSCGYLKITDVPKDDYCVCPKCKEYVYNFGNSPIFSIDNFDDIEKEVEKSFNNFGITLEDFEQPQEEIVQKYPCITKDEWLEIGTYFGIYTVMKELYENNNSK